MDVSGGNDIFHVRMDALFAPSARRWWQFAATSGIRSASISAKRMNKHARAGTQWAY